MRYFQVSLLLLFFSITGSVSSAFSSFHTMGTGSILGVYFPLGKSMARIINSQRAIFDVRVMVEPTGGSVFNIHAIQNGDMCLALAQSDRLYQAYNGQGEWLKKGAQKELRSLFTLHPEAITLLVNHNSSIRSLHDLQGKIVNIGRYGSGQQHNAIDVLGLAGLRTGRGTGKRGTDQKTQRVQNIRVSTARAVSLLRQGEIDALFLTIGHPNPMVASLLTGSKPFRILPLTKAEGLDEQRLEAEFPYYMSLTIPSSAYPSVQQNETIKDIQTLGVKATLITSTRIPDSVIYGIVKSIFTHIETLKKSHPALSSLQKASMLQGLEAPLHPGALQYYREAGLLP